MNTYPLVDMLALFTSGREEKPQKDCVKYLKRVRSCHNRENGGIKRSFYTTETKEGDIVNLIFNENELTWKLEDREGFSVSKVIALVQRHKHAYSRAHRIIPYRVEIVPAGEVGTGSAFADRVQPFRFQTGKIPSTQVIRIVRRRQEDLIMNRHLHYIVKTDQHRFFHLVYIMDECDWRILKEVDPD